MKSWGKSIVLIAAGALGAGGAAAAKEGPAACGDYGTSVHFEATPAAAARQAKAEEKLVLVLHVSGHFENPEFT